MNSALPKRHKLNGTRKSGVKKIIFILGGARSGKSNYAVELAKKLKKKVVFIATATSCDKEMEKRIKLHKISRPRQWKLIEESKDVSSVLSKLNGKTPYQSLWCGGKYEVVLIDCLGLLISNLLIDNLEDKEIERRIKKLINILLKVKFTTILVSNEVGSGIVPENALSRRFRDLVGFANQMLAKKADEVIFMQSGIPIQIKSKSKNQKSKF